MDDDTKKIIKLVLKLLILGLFFKAGFDIKAYLSIQDTLDTTKEVLLLVLLTVIVAFIICSVLISIVRSYDKKKEIDNTRRRIDRLENKMKSTKNNRTGQGVANNHTGNNRTNRGS